MVVLKETETIANMLRTVFYTLFGFYMFTLWLLFVVFITFPTILYQLFLTKIIVPVFNPPEIVKVVSGVGHAIATEFISSYGKNASRCSNVVAKIMDGHINLDSFKNELKNRWIEAVDKTSGRLKYPELKFYIDQWMGFMFWKVDANFHINKHIFVHNLDKASTALESQRFVDALVEDLLNKPYQSRQSPWEIHLVFISSYPELSPNGNKTVLLFRVHHAMADGFSVFQMFFEGLSYGKVSYPPPRKDTSLTSFPKRILKTLTLPFVYAHDLGKELSSLVFSSQTPWHCPDQIKTGRQLYIRSPIIPLDKVKFIKNKMGCNFSSVLISSISAGVAQSFKLKGFKAKNGTFCILYVLPLHGHPETLSNHMTGTVLDVSTETCLSPMQRLSITEETYRKSVSSTIPLIVPIFMRTVSVQLAPLSRYFSKIRFIASAVSNFRGQMQPTWITNAKVLTSHACTVGLHGDVGVTFCILGIENHVYVSVTAEEAVMSRNELQTLIKTILDHIDELYNISNTMD